MKQKTVSQFLFILAFLADLLVRSIAGTTASVLIASVALFFFIRALKVPKRIARIESAKEEFFVSFTCALLFCFSNYVSKILFPFVVLPMEVTPTKFAVLLGSAIVTYAMFRFVWIHSGHRDRYFQPSSEKEREIKDIFERVIGGLVILAVLNGLDGADLMLLVSLIISFSSEIYAFFTIVTRNVMTFLDSFKTNLKARRIELSKFVNQIAHDFRQIRSKDFDEIFWNRAFDLIKYKKGLAFLFISFTCSFPLIFVSWSIDFLNFRPEFLVGLILLMIPSITSIVIVRMPVEIVESRKETWRSIILSLSLVISVMISVVMSFHPSLLPPLGDIPNTQELNRLRVGAALLTSLLPVFTGLPIYFGIVNAQVNNYAGFVKWGKVAGFSPFPLLLILMLLSSFYVATATASLIFLVLIAYLVTTGFYLFMSYVIWSTLHDWEKRTGKDFSNLASRVFNLGPNIITLIPSAAIGISILVLACQNLQLHVVDVPFAVVAPFAISFSIGSVLQCLSLKNWKTSIWVFLFASTSYLLSYSLLMLSFLTIPDFIQLFSVIDYKIIPIRLAMILLGNMFAMILASKLKRKQ